LRQESQEIVGAFAVGAAFISVMLLQLMTSDIDPATGQYRPWVDWTCVDLPCLIQNEVSRPVLISLVILGLIIGFGILLIERKEKGKER